MAVPVVFGVVLGLSAALAAQPATGTDGISMTAASANVKESGAPVKIRILRWSTDAEREAFVAALSPPPPAPPGAAGDRGGAAGGGRGGAGRGAAGGGEAAGGRGGAGRGRGEAVVAPPDPIAALTTALGKAPVLGYIWTSEVTGYSIKYAYRTALPDGGERIILATDRRLGRHTTAWQPGAATPSGAEGSAETDYEFTLIEMRLDPKGTGEGKASLTTKVIIDNGAKTVALDNYAATPAILRNVKR